MLEHLEIAEGAVIQGSAHKVLQMHMGASVQGRLIYSVRKKCSRSKKGQLKASGWSTNNYAMQLDIEFSERAANKVKRLIETRATPACLRVFITGGGCNGFLRFYIRDTPAQDDIIERLGVRMLVDAMSYPYLAGSNVDYVEDLSGSQFTSQTPMLLRPAAAAALF